MLGRHDFVVEEAVYVPSDRRGRVSDTGGDRRLRDPGFRPDECEDGMCRRTPEVKEDPLFDRPVPPAVLEVPGGPALPHDRDSVVRLEQVEVVPERLAVHEDQLGDRREVDPGIRDDCIIDGRSPRVFEQVIPINPALAGETVRFRFAEIPRKVTGIPESSAGVRHRTGTMR